YFLFRQYMVPKGRKLIDKILLCGIGIIGAAVAIITVVRFASDEHSVDIWTWVSLYTGEGVLNFCSDLWSLDKTSNGDNTFLMLRYVFGLTNNIDIESVRKTRDVLGIRNSVFYTYLGTIYFDFNKIGTFVFVCFFSALFCKICKVKARGVRLGQLIYLAILGKVIMMGMMFYPYTLWNDQLSLLLLLVFTWALNHKEKLAYSC
ncbi:MAG: oligosaccharide repeat unit polymerase, partial [Paraprevotella sp.]|nr:oligosaccharide repeat unit polymerase [Paraprevotella sp.]